MRRFPTLFVTLLLACQGTTAPDISERPPDFQGTIVFITEDGRFRLDDGTHTACGFSDVHVPETAEIRWHRGPRASRSALRIGRRIAIWQPDEGRGPIGARCGRVDARLVVIDLPLPR